MEHGFISAKFGLPYTGPLTYLLVRFALVTALMTALAIAMRATWLAGRSRTLSRRDHRLARTRSVPWRSVRRHFARHAAGLLQCWSGCSQS
jgi:hypothetical protein